MRQGRRTQSGFTDAAGEAGFLEGERENSGLQVRIMQKITMQK